MHLDFECEGTDEGMRHLFHPTTLIYHTQGDQDDLVHTIRSHLSKDVIIWSSDPKVSNQLLFLILIHKLITYTVIATNTGISAKRCPGKLILCKDSKEIRCLYV